MDKDMTSGCPYQKGRTTIICEACGLMVPSMDEKKEYCEGNFRKCPYYKEGILREMDEILRDTPEGREVIR